MYDFRKFNRCQFLEMLLEIEQSHRTTINKQNNNMRQTRPNRPITSFRATRINKPIRILQRLPSIYQYISSAYIYVRNIYIYLFLFKIYVLAHKEILQGSTIALGQVSARVTFKHLLIEIFQSVYSLYQTK